MLTKQTTKKNESALKYTKEIFNNFIIKERQIFQN